MEEKDNAGAVDQDQDNGSSEESQEQAPTAEELIELRKDAAAFKDQKKRAEIAEAELKKLKPTQEQKPAPKQEASSAASTDDVVRARLEARGVLDEDEQDAVIEAAKVLNLTPIKALDNEIVKGRLAAIRTQKKTNDATPAPSRGGGTTTNIGRLADKALQTGELPTDPALKAQVKAEMRRRK